VDARAERRRSHHHPVLASAHLSADETVLALTEARRRGVHRLLVNPPEDGLRRLARPRGSSSHPRSEYGAIVVLAGLFRDQSMKTFPGRSVLVIFAFTRSDVSLANCSAGAFAFADMWSVAPSPACRL
jgi:hypothetical protein